MPSVRQAPNRPPLQQLAEQARSLAASLASVASASGASQDFPPAPPPTGEQTALAATARHYLRARRLREPLFAKGLFCDPAWDMLLDLFASQVEGKPVCVSDASIAAGVPQTTGLRWLDTLARHGLITRHRDPLDGRRCFVEMTPAARNAVATWLASTFPS